MKTEIEISMPESWADVSLTKYLELQRDLEAYVDDEEATTAILFHHLCGLTAIEMKALSQDSYNLLKHNLANFLKEPNRELIPIITIGGVEYGFEPNLSQMTYGAYADITKFEKLTIDENWSKIMSILYRPVVRKHNKNYIIQPYDGSDRSKLFEEVNMDVHFGALFFFVHLLTDLLKSTQNFMMAMDIPDNYKQILVKSGQLTQRLLNLPVETLEK